MKHFPQFLLPLILLLWTQKSFPFLNFVHLFSFSLLNGKLCFIYNALNFNIMNFFCHHHTFCPQIKCHFVLEKYLNSDFIPSKNFVLFFKPLLVRLYVSLYSLQHSLLNIYFFLFLCPELEASLVKLELCSLTFRRKTVKSSMWHGAC